MWLIMKKYIYWNFLINATVQTIRFCPIYLVYRSRDRCVIQSLRRTWSGSTHAQCLRPADPHRRRCWEINRCDGTWIPSERSAHSGQEGKNGSLGGLQARVGVNGWRVAGFAVQMKRAGERRKKKVCDTDRGCVSAMTHWCPVQAINWLTKSAICFCGKTARHLLGVGLQPVAFQAAPGSVRTASEFSSNSSSFNWGRIEPAPWTALCCGRGAIWGDGSPDLMHVFHHEQSYLKNAIMCL